MVEKGAEFKKELARFKEAMEKTLGDAIRKPTVARLGWENELGEKLVKVSRDRSDEPDRYYFHDIGNGIFKGVAYLKLGSLAPTQIRFGTPVRIEKDVLTKEYLITGVDTFFGSQYFDGVEEDDFVFIPYPKLVPGLLTETQPPSMSAKVLAGAYRSGSDWKYIQTQNTVNWSLAPNFAEIPTTPGKSVFALVALNYATELLEYQYGAEISSTVSFEQAYLLDKTAGSHTYLPLAASTHFRCGYIKLTYGMTSINKKGGIWSIQDYLVLGAGGDPSVLDRILTNMDGDILVNSAGNVIYS